MNDFKAALTANRESRSVEFKAAFDVDSLQDWCELIKDLIAISNQGGGFVLVGVADDGSFSGFDVSKVLALDPAKITDKVVAYVGGQHFECDIRKAKRGGHRIAVLVIAPADYPYVFSRPGTYPVGERQQKSAFSVGTVYFRHGAKSAPSTSEDLRKFLERKLASVRREWLTGVRKVVGAPAGSVVKVLPPEVHPSDAASATPIRITDDPKAPGVAVADPDLTHPFRQVEVIRELKSRFSELGINAYDMLCVRLAHSSDRDRRHVYKSKFASPRYSQAFVDWVSRAYQKDKDFFRKARSKYEM